MVDRARPNRPQPRPGATEANPQAEPATGRGRDQEHATERGAASGGQQLAGREGAQGATGTGGATGSNQGGNTVPLGEVFQLAQWAAEPVESDDELSYRRGQVRSILYAIVDGMFPE